MAFNKYNSPGWSDGFNSIQETLQNYHQRQELAADAAAPDPLNVAPNPDPTSDQGKNIGLISVANPNNMGPQQSEADGGERVDAPNVMVPDPAGQPGLANAPSPSSVAAAAAATATARAQRRATIYRKYGDDTEGDKLLASNANLGLTNAQTRGAVATADFGETKATDARRASDDLQSISDVNESVAKQVSDAGIDTSTAEGGAKANKLRVDALIKAGQFGEAKIATEQLTAMTANTIKAQTDQRQSAANAIINASRGGKLTADLVSSFHDNFIPDGSTVKSTTINKDGGFTMKLSDGSGKESTQTVPGDKISDLFGMLGSPDSSAFITAQIAGKSKLALEAAQTKQAVAGAGASNASAGYSSALTEEVRRKGVQGALDDVNGNKVREARIAENSPAGATPEQTALIGAADDDAISRRARIDPSGTEAIRVAEGERKHNATTITQLSNALLTASPTAKVELQKQMDTAMRQRDEIAKNLEEMGASARARRQAPGLSTVAPPSTTVPNPIAPPTGAASVPSAKRPSLSSFQR